jgi:hypothetical protein
MIMVRYNKWFLQKWETTRRMGFFDSNGNKTAMATYDNGQKSENGFLNDTVLSEEFK